MERIFIDAQFGDEVKKIELSEVKGTSSIWWNVSIGIRVYCSINYRYGKWMVELHRDSQFCFEDGEEMIRLVSANYPELKSV